MRTITFVVTLLFAHTVMAQWTPYADTIFINGSVTTVDEDFTIDEAIAVKDGRIMATGTTDDVMAHSGNQTRIIDLDGRTIIPGLQDSHIHFLALGHQMNFATDFTFANSAEDILTEVEALKNRLNLEPEEWITGYRWDEYKYPNMVTRWQLDAIAPQNPVRLTRVYRGVAVNTRVFELMGIYDDQPDTWPAWWLENPDNFTFEDRIFREERTLTINGRRETYNVPTGVFLGSIATTLVTVAPPPTTMEEDVESVRLGVREMLSLGVTSIIDPASNMGYNMDVYQEAYNRGYLDMRISAVYEGIFFGHSPEEIDDHLGAIKVNNLGDSFLRWRGSKVYADGGTGTRSSWLSEPFEGWQDLEKVENHGVPVMADTDFRESQFRAILDHGWELHTHNTGDQAMRQTMDLYMKLLDEKRAEEPAFDPRWSIIHAYFPIEPKTMVLPDMARYGVVASTNPIFIWQLGNSFFTNTGQVRMDRLMPFKSYKEGGVIMAAGSDFSVATHNPWMGFYAMLTRIEQSSGQARGPDERLGIEDALRAMTWNGAYLTHEEDFKGSLEVGKVADLVVLDIPDIYELERNPGITFEMPERVDMTMVEGRIVYQEGSSVIEAAR